jgi:hypothetical protein
MNDAPNVTPWPPLSKSAVPDSRAPTAGSELLST